MLLMVVKSICRTEIAHSCLVCFFFLKTSAPYAFLLQYYNEHLSVVVQNEHLVHVSGHQS